MFCGKGVLRNFAKFAGKHLCQRLFFNKVAGLRIRVPKVPFRFFDKLKYEIKNKVLIFVSILKLRQKTSKQVVF